ncbi:MAG: hypothetical protein JWM02_461 [Frankiales bacterium]|nr:hypothetical protein [Frankiales bacterium]
MDIPVEAARQRGCFSYEQALVAGWHKAHVETAERTGRLVRVRPGVYAERDVLAALDQRGRHLLDIRAAQLALGPRWFAARRSGAVVLGVPLIGTPPSRPQLVADRVGEAETHDRHRRLSALPRADRGACEGVQVVSPARVVADIAREESFRNAVVVADAVLGSGLEREEVLACLGRMRRWPGVAKARRAVEFADGLSETPLESISRVAMHELGLPAPELQVEVWLGGRFLGRVDKLWRQFNTVGEDDGVGKYGEDDASLRTAFRKEKVRQEWMEDVGLEVARWTWGQAWRPRGVLDARLERAFARGRRQELDPRVRFVPTTVADRLRRAA